MLAEVKPARTRGGEDLMPCGQEQNLMGVIRNTDGTWGGAGTGGGSILMLSVLKAVIL